ncbi:DUF1212-domain-containing protein [Fomitiporia mediterranea MF3/22]|uniref:DUF1212-domain-containing protein n=1 Tax=Fomitiporia mediterranea (strain MF3/22) TaxID=694068 RepID=UPI0004409BB0|nr:DUF1212-domain-containing protein [Fomitiporia mediterranea MF3/22]EJD01769.1 DUF1212-domain-containing protein [Fomitiporia mediterranea MF3/22]
MTHESRSVPSEGRPRAASDTYTTIPTRSIRQNNTSLRRASDATNTTRPLRIAKQQRASSVHPDPASPHYHRNSNNNAPNFDRAASWQQALDALNGKRDSRPATPERVYDSPAVQHRTTLSDPHYSSPASVRDSQQYLKPPPQLIYPNTHPSSPAQTYYLPTYNQFGRMQVPQQEPQKSFPTRAFEFFKSIAKEPPLLSPPPSPPVSRRTSFVGGTRTQNDEKSSQYRQSESEYSHDVFVRAMDINGESDARNTLVTDADVQLYSEPPQGAQKPFFLRNLKQGAMGEAYGETHLSYRERRKKRKHQIVHNRDTEDAQQRFIITFALALIAFGSPSHRIEPQLASTAALFELPAQFVHTPNCVQICFGRPEAHASETLLVKANSSLDLGRIHDTHGVYRAVVRDEISATEGRKRLEDIIRRPPTYSQKLQCLFAFVQGVVLCGSSFGGSLNDMWVAGILSLLATIVQNHIADSQHSSSGSDVFMAAIVSLVARALSSRVPGQIFCYQSISSTGVAGLLPGSIMLSGVLDIASKNILLGSPKLVSGIMTSLYLGFGLTIGSDIWLTLDKKSRDYMASMADRFESFYGTFYSTNDTTPDWLAASNLTGTWAFQETSSAALRDVINGCYRDPSWSWYLRPLPWYSLVVLLPVLNLVLSMRRGQPLLTKQMPVMVIISCISTAATQVANRNMGLAGHPDYAALLGSFVVSLLGNLYSRKMGGTAYTIMLTGIWLLIPTGLAEAGGLSSSYIEPGQDEYTESLDLARKMISVIIGVMSGVYLSARLIYAFGKKKNSAFVTF